MALRWRILALLFLVRCVMALQFSTIGAIGPLIQDRFAVDAAAIGWLVGLYFLPGVFIALPGGTIARLIGDTRVVLIGLGFMAAGSFLAGLVPVWEAQLAGRLVAGIGGVLLNVLMSKLVLDWFTGREIATAMSVFVSSWPVGIGLGLWLQPVLAGNLGSATPYFVEAGLALAGLVAIAAFYRPPPGAAAQFAPAHAGALGLRAFLAVMMAGAVWGLFNAALGIILGFGPSVLIAEGWALAAAGAAISLVPWSVVISGPLGGHLSDRFGRPAPILLAGAGVQALCLWLFPLVEAYGAMLLIMGVAGGLAVGPIMALPSKVLTAQNRAVGMGVFYTVYYICFALAPWLAGLRVRAAGQTVAAFNFAAWLLIGAILSTFAFLLIAGKKPKMQS